MIIDSHALVFTRACALAPDRRDTPGDDAPLETYPARLDRHGISHAALVQPSFLGTDNTYLLESLARAPDRLLGPRDRPALAAMARRGVVGLQRNLVGETQGWRADRAVIDLAASHPLKSVSSTPLSA